MDLETYAALKKIKDAPTEFCLLEHGIVERDGAGPLTVDEEAVKSIIGRFKARGIDMVIDYEHQTDKDVQAPAAGWIKELIDRGEDGIWARVEWTDTAQAYLKAKEYRYFSPVLYYSKKTGRVFSVEHVALTNYPKLNNLTPLVAKNGRDEPEDEAMLKKLIAKLKLKDNATEADVMAAIEAMTDENGKLALKAKAVAHEDVLAALGAKPGDDVAVVVAKAKAMQGTDKAAQDLAAQVSGLKAELDGIKADGLVQEALKAGKLSPAEAEKWGKDLAKASPDQFNLIVGAREPGSVVPIGELPGKTDDGKPAPTDMDMEVAKSLGLTREDLEKYGGE